MIKAKRYYWIGTMAGDNCREEIRPSHRSAWHVPPQCRRKRGDVFSQTAGGEWRLWKRRIKRSHFHKSGLVPLELGDISWWIIPSLRVEEREGTQPTPDNKIKISSKIENFPRASINIQFNQIFQLSQKGRTIKSTQRRPSKSYYNTNM